MKKRHLVMLGMVLLAGAIALACVSKKKFSKEFYISSNPPGAEVLLDGQPMGNTPVNVTMDFELNLDYPDRGLIRHEVIVKKKGYVTKRKSVYHNDPPRVHFELEKEEGGTPPPPPPPPPPPRQP